MLAKLLTQMIMLLQTIGYNVVVVNGDQSAVNRKCFGSLGMTPDDPYFYVNGEKVFGTFDIPHLYKSVSKKSLFFQCTFFKYFFYGNFFKYFFFRMVLDQFFYVNHF